MERRSHVERITRLTVPALWWVVASGVGGALGGAGMGLTGLAGLLFLGPLFATPQALVLGRYGVHNASGWWIPTTVGVLAACLVGPFAMSAGLFLGSLLTASQSWAGVDATSASVLASLAAPAGDVGAMQRSLLTGSVSGVRWWIAASAIGGIPMAVLVLWLVSTSATFDSGHQIQVRQPGDFRGHRDPDDDNETSVSIAPSW